MNLDNRHERSRLHVLADLHELARLHVLDDLMELDMVKELAGVVSSFPMLQQKLLFSNSAGKKLVFFTAIATNCTELKAAFYIKLKAL